MESLFRLFTILNQYRLTFYRSFVLLFVFFLMLIIASLIKANRLRTRIAAMKRIPRKRTPLGKKDIPERVRRQILAGSSDASELTCAAPVVNANGFGWGQPGGDYEKVHFKSSIGKSFFILEKAATHYNEDLARDPRMSLREYIEFLKKRVPDLDPGLSETYLSEYEGARFSSKQFTLNEYTSFMKLLLALLQAFDKGTPVDNDFKEVSQDEEEER